MSDEHRQDTSRDQTDQCSAARSGDGIPRGRLRRAVPVAGLMARTTGEAAVTAVRRRLGGRGASVDFERAAERYAQLLGHSKGALMKAGQALSFTSWDGIVPPEARGAYQRAFARLREHAPAMAAEIARAVLESELGRPVEAVFAEFDAEPLAAASIGQVHRARLHDGRAVAVKIQYPGAAAAIEADLANLELLASFFTLVTSFLPRRIGVDLRAMAGEVSEQIHAELDYRREADNQRAFADFYRGHPFIHIPEVVDEFSTRRVLTQELVEGLTYEQACAAEESLREGWAQAVLRFNQGSIKTFGIVNVDPHPGNYRFHPDGTVSFLDFGCVIRMPPQRLQQLVCLQRASLRGDVQGAWQAALQAGVWRQSDPVTPQEAFEYWHESQVMYWGPQPFRITPAVVAAAIERHHSPTGPSANALRYLHSPESFALIDRMDFGALSVIAGLDVALNWQAITRESFEHQPPSTEQSRQHWQFITTHHPAAPIRPVALDDRVTLDTSASVLDTQRRSTARWN